MDIKHSVLKGLNCINNLWEITIFMKFVEFSTKKLIQKHGRNSDRQFLFMLGSSKL